MCIFNFILLILSSAAEQQTKECTEGYPDIPPKACNRTRDCTSNLDEYEGWCDFETKYCCYVDPSLTELPMCPDRLTPLYGQERCTNATKEMVYSGMSVQNGGFCYKGYSCPPKITSPHDLKFGSMTFRTNMDCYSDVKVKAKFNFMFCHNATGKLWVIGQYNVNGDDVIQHWTYCEVNSDCGEGLVCVKEDLDRYRCYEDPTMAVDYDWIVVQILATFFSPLLFLVSVIVFTIKYLD